MPWSRPGSVGRKNTSFLDRRSHDQSVSNYAATAHVAAPALVAEAVAMTWPNEGKNPSAEGKF
jgi:hypothetical protein